MAMINNMNKVLHRIVQALDVHETHKNELHVAVDEAVPVEPETPAETPVIPTT